MHKYSYALLLKFSVLFLSLSLCYIDKGYAQVNPIPNAHAHNDYQHQNPLHDALAQGFTSIEADILLIEGELYVGHDMPTGEHHLPTLKATYLTPLLEIIKENDGQVYPEYKLPVYLMLDLKTEAEETYKILKMQLREFQKIICVEKKGKLTARALRVFLSGNRPLQTVYNEKKRFVGIDGRPADLDKNYPASFMPVISENYFKILEWDGSGTIPKEERDKLEKLAEKAHQQNKKLRLWAAPDNENAWKTLLDAGVDFINTDRLREFSSFWNTYTQEQQN